MDETLICTLLLLSVSAAFGKYIHVDRYVSWYEAQRYCRKFYTDLAPIRNQRDLARLHQLDNIDFDVDIFLFGLRKDSETWKWSGGGEVSEDLWGDGQPSNQQYRDYGLLINDRWHDAYYSYNPFLCYSAVVVRERKTWEEALKHCREHHGDLASVGSDTEMLLVQKELAKATTTQYVWVGLHFMAGRWLWVDGEPVEYESWGQGGRPACPAEELQCGALQVMGGAQNRTIGRTEVQANNTGSYETFGKHLPINPAVDDRATDVNQGVWEAHNCEEKLHFICY